MYRDLGYMVKSGSHASGTIVLMIMEGAYWIAWSHRESALPCGGDGP
jgi:hypothetical protein